MMHEESFNSWMKVNYPNMRLDSVTASFYREVWIAACERKDG